MIYYCRQTQGFYDSELHDISQHPHLIAIDEATHLALLQGQARGQSIVLNPQGFPMLTDPAPSQWHEWDSQNQQWTLPESKKEELLQSAKTQAEAQINDTAAAILAKPARFAAEYELREQQAKQFAENDYEGKAPEQVAAFAHAASLPEKQATEIILQQAQQLRAALAQIGVLRMKKFELKQCESVKDVQNKTAEIIAAMQAIGAQL